MDIEMDYGALEFRRVVGPPIPGRNKRLRLGAKNAAASSGFKAGKKLKDQVAARRNGVSF